MNEISLATALGVLRDAVGTHPVALEAGLRQEIGQLCTHLFQDLTGSLELTQDPRVVLQALELIESQFRAVIRSQLLVTAAAEATGAHTLSIGEYNRLRDGTTDWQRPAERVTGRAHYKETSTLIAAWTGIDEFEAMARVADTHRLVARRTMAGTPAGPRFEALSEIFLDPGTDPRTVRNAARRIEKFEPADQISQGTALPPVAAGPDGVLLEEHVARILRAGDQVTASKRVSAVCNTYKQANSAQIRPTEYLRRIRTVMGVDIYQFAVDGANAEAMRSIVAQLDNPNTLAGKAARRGGTASGEASRDGSRPEHTSNPEAVSGSAEPIPVWLRPTEPAPPWAVDPLEPERAGTANPDTIAEPIPAQGVQPRDATRSESGALTADNKPPAADTNRVQSMTDGSYRAQGGDTAVAAAGIPAPPDAGTDPESGSTAGHDPDSNGEIPVDQRRLNGFMALLRQRLSGKGNRTQVIPTIQVYMHLSQLMDLAVGHGITAHGVNIGPAELRRMLCDAHVIPNVLDGEGQVLDVGRSKRTFDGARRSGLMVRDRGCIRPGCTYPPELCEGHHWPDGGWAGGCGTSIDVGAMLCPRDHDDAHAGKIRIVKYKGLPHVLLPKYLDPSQTPRRNQYWFGGTEDLTKPPPLPRPKKPQAVEPPPEGAALASGHPVAGQDPSPTDTG